MHGRQHRVAPLYQPPLRPVRARNPMGITPFAFEGGSSNVFRMLVGGWSVELFYHKLDNAVPLFVVEYIQCGICVYTSRRNTPSGFLLLSYIDTGLRNLDERRERERDRDRGKIADRVTRNEADSKRQRIAGMCRGYKDTPD